MKEESAGIYALFKKDGPKNQNRHNQQHTSDIAGLSHDNFLGKVITGNGGTR